MSSAATTFLQMPQSDSNNTASEPSRIAELILACFNFVCYLVILLFVLIKNHKTLSVPTIVLLVLPSLAYSALVGVQSY